MNIQKLQQDFKDDLNKIKQLKLSTLSAKETYLPVLYLFVKSYLLLYATTTLSAIFLYFAFNFSSNFLYQATHSNLWVLALLSFLVVGSLSNYVVFSKMMLGEFKTAPFVRKKMTQLTIVFFCLYFVIISSFLYYFKNHSEASVDFSMFFSEISSFIASCILMNIILSLEIQRLGLNSLFEVVVEFFKHRDKQKSGLVE